MRTLTLRHDLLAFIPHESSTFSDNFGARTRVCLGKCPDELRLRAAFEPVSVDERRQAWQRTARGRAPQLVGALREGVAELCAREQRAWALAPVDPGLAPHFLNGRQLWSGHTYMDGRPAEPGGPGRVSMQVFTDRVEPQLIELAFRRLPDQERVHVVFGALAALLDQAAA